MKKDGEVGAYKHDGYTDGTFNYYRDQFGWWYAIETESGMAACSDSTLKKAAPKANTPRMLEAIAKLKNTAVYKSYTEQLQTLVKGEAIQ